MRKLIRNAIKCKKCGDVIESKTRHDFKECSCKACYVDGGLDYCRVGGKLEDIEFLTEYADVPAYIIEYMSFSGIYKTSSFENLDEIINHWEREGTYKIRVSKEHGEVVYESKGFKYS